MDSNVEESRLLINEPSPQLLIPAVGQSAQEVRRVIIHVGLGIIGYVDKLALHLSGDLGILLELAFNCHFVLGSVLIDILNNCAKFFVLIIQELYSFEDLKPVESELGELVETDGALRGFLVEAGSFPGA